MVVLLRMNSKAARDSTGTVAESFSPLRIPPEELFFPDEPDFLPPIMTERQPRESWTAEDALPFWTDPGEKDSARWRERIRSVIDELMERVP
jgi:hypothetical protein